MIGEGNVVSCNGGLFIGIVESIDGCEYLIGILDADLCYQCNDAEFLAENLEEHKEKYPEEFI